MNIGELKRIIEELPDDTLVVAPDIGYDDDGFTDIHLKEVMIDYGRRDGKGNYHYNENYGGVEAICITKKSDQ